MATAPSEIPALRAGALDPALQAQRRAHESDPYPTLETRRARLDRLRDLLRDNDLAIRKAIDADFGNRAHEETLLLEQFTSLEGIGHTRRHLRRWMRRERRGVAWWSLPGRAQLMRQPLGVVGIIVPWNYPLYLAVSPLAAALAAGNRVMLKMSEFTPNFGALFERLVSGAFAAEEVLVINGGVEVAQAFSGLPFDHLLFTGSTAVGRAVMKAASEHLTPVTLELGGKSPAIIAEGFPLAESARRVMYGKLANAGQTCVAPDYALVPDARIEEFIAACREATNEFYPTLAANPQYTSIVNERQFRRLASCLDDARARGGVVHELHPEATDPARRRLSPVAVTRVSGAMRLMQEEIFGPLLPVVGYDTLDDAIAFVNARPRPLALYYFGAGGAQLDAVLKRTVSGGVTVNNTMLHVAQEDLPFGGVGPSGMGHYHGQAGFDTFSKQKAIYLDGRLSGSRLLQPPYGRAFKFMMRILNR